jgi:hypothetical protein
MSDIIETNPSDDHGADSESADGLEGSSPPRNPNLAKQIRCEWIQNNGFGRNAHGGTRQGWNTSPFEQA